MIIDDYEWFNMKEVISGNGLHTMNERAQTLNGELEIVSKPLEGTRVTLVFSPGHH